MKALVEPSGRIAEICAREFPVAPPLSWIEVPNNVPVTPHWRVENNAFIEPPSELQEQIAPEEDSLSALAERIKALEAKVAGIEGAR